MYSIQWNYTMWTPLKSGHIDYADTFKVPTIGTILAIQTRLLEMQTPH